MRRLSIGSRIVLALVALPVWFLMIPIFVTFPTLNELRTTIAKTQTALLTLESLTAMQTHITTLATASQSTDRAALDDYVTSAQMALEDYQAIASGGANGAEYQTQLDTLVAVAYVLVEAQADDDEMTQSQYDLFAGFMAMNLQISAEMQDLVEDTQGGWQGFGAIFQSRLTQFRTVTILTIPLTFILAWLLVRTTLNPIRRLQSEIVGVQAKPLNASIDPQSYEHEMRGLAQAFDHFVQQIRQDNIREQQTEEQLRQQDRFLRQVIDTIPNYVFVRDYDGHYVMVNVAMALANNTTSKEMVGKTEIDFQPTDETYHRFLKEDRQIMDAGEATFRAEDYAIEAPEDRRYFDVVKVPLANAQGRFDRILVVMTDVTERVQNERTLAQARDLAEASSRLKSEFLATMSHELRTPLNAIIGFSSLMLEDMTDDPVNAENRDMIQSIHESSHQLLRIINDLLDLSKLEAGRMKLDQSLFSIEEVMTNLFHKQLPNAQKKNLKFQVEIAEDVPTIPLLGDAMRIEQVIDNLISNAIKFTPRGRVEVYIAWENEALKIQVRDTGIGISPEVQDYIFEAFRQGDGSKKRQHGGSGMGLSITARLVRLMGGNITIDSDLGEGSTFTVELPLSLSSPPSVDMT
jgi:PAS domain S-box-containing protein